VAEVLSEESPKKLTRMGINDQFGKSGTSKKLKEYFGLTPQNIINKVLKM